MKVEPMKVIEVSSTDSEEEKGTATTCDTTSDNASDMVERHEWP